MAKIKIKPKKTFPPSATLTANAPKDLHSVKKAIAHMVLMHNAVKQKRGKSGALGGKGDS